MILTSIDDDQPVRRVTFIGDITSKEFLEYSSQELPFHQVAFIDLEQMRSIDLLADGVMQHASSVGTNLNDVSAFTEIIFAPSELAYGMARMYQNYVFEKFEVLIFRDRAAAQAELQKRISLLETLP